ncbi:MAG: hypothetical protein HY903_24955 [Deltaproteobacteria bacterium]|nr:hypothetical protein [Deltaproteobacteria bacterium]
MRLWCPAPLLLVACAGIEGMPFAVLSAAPDMLCEGAPPTEVTLSARGSIDGDGDDAELSFQWSTTPAPLAVIRGSLTAIEWIGSFPTASPVSIDLTVTDDHGAQASRRHVLPLTRTAAVSCDAGCLDHEICAVVDGQSLCVEAATCTGDDECGCLRCRQAADATWHCATG